MVILYQKQKFHMYLQVCKQISPLTHSKYYIKLAEVGYFFALLIFRSTVSVFRFGPLLQYHQIKLFIIAKIIQNKVLVFHARRITTWRKACATII